MAVLRLKLVTDAPADGQAVQPVTIDGLDSGGVIDTVEVTTLNSGEEATGSIDGSTLKLGIPRGADGKTGATGAQGATGAAGAKGDQGDPGADGVGVQSITLITSGGKVTEGTWKDTSGSSHTITIQTNES